MAGKADYYELLQVAKDADGDTIKRSFRSLAMKYHPDKNPGCAESEAKFKEICEAYEVLKDGQKRAAYDRYGHAAFTQGQGGFGGGFGGMDLGEMFGEMFREFMGGGQPGGRSRVDTSGSDLRYDMEITMEEAYVGINREIEVASPRLCDICKGTGMEGHSEKATCPDCHGSGRVRVKQLFMVMESPCHTCSGLGEIIKNPCRKCKGSGRTNVRRTLKINIPPGVDTGSRIRLSGEGEAGFRGGQAGDLYVITHVKQHKFFERDGANLYGGIPVGMTTAALGGEVKIPTIDGQGYVMKIPKGTQHGEQIRIKQLGMPKLRGSDNGDLFVRINIEIPTKLSKRQEELLAEFDVEAEKNGSHPGVSGFWDRLKDLFN